jgi:hypothetical protein
MAFFFWNLMKDSWRRWVLIAVVVTNIVAGLAHFLLAVFQCGVPNHGEPFAYKKMTNQCVSTAVVLGIGYPHSLINALTDVILCSLPIPLIWKSGFRRREKIFMSIIVTLAGM